MADAVTIDSVLSGARTTIDATLERWIPRKFDDASFAFMCGKLRYASDAESATRAIADPIWDILDRGGKRWRPTLMLLTLEAMGAGVPDAQRQAVVDLIVLCELVHNGSLVVDDIEDKSQLRRGKPCLHLCFPADIAINAGNMMYFFGTLVLRELRGKVPDALLLRAYEYYSAEGTLLHVGQGLDIAWHNGWKNPSIDEYLQMCAFKTGTLARLSAKLGALMGGASEADVEVWGAFAESVGIAFQIQDDILNLVGEKFTTSITGEDISEGKRSLMVIHTTLNADDKTRTRLHEILELHTTERALIDEAIGILKAQGSIDFARARAKTIIESAWKEVEPLIKDDVAKAKLHCFAKYLIERDI